MTKRTAKVMTIGAIVALVIYVALVAGFIASRVVPLDDPIPQETMYNTGRDGSYADQKVAKTIENKVKEVEVVKQVVGSLK